MEELRREITQYQASIIDLTKWKLIFIGTIGAVGLGLTGDGAAKVSEISSLILCVIPFACNYVDAICKNLQIKTCSLRLIMAQVGDKVVEQSKENVVAAKVALRGERVENALRIFLIFTLEEMVLTLSTATINFGLILYAMIFHSQFSNFIIAASIIGFLFMFYVEILYRVHMKRIIRD
jgi:hypothetical protein